LKIFIGEGLNKNKDNISNIRYNKGGFNENYTSSIKSNYWGPGGKFKKNIRVCSCNQKRSPRSYRDIRACAAGISTTGFVT
jgi:hypothetical protein